MILFGLPALVVLIDFIHYIITGNHFLKSILKKIIDFVIIALLPSLYVFLFDDSVNDCCSNSAVFSPEHKITIYTIIILSALAYLYSSYRKNINAPLIEVFLNCLIFIGIILNIFIFVQVHAKNDSDTIALSIMGNIPIIFLGLMMLADNHKLFLNNYQNRTATYSGISKVAWQILNLNYFKKAPILLISCLPLIIVIICLLLIFGQKPDSIILVFTDTYKHGFSQLDYMCENVVCDGHYLCTIAAKGHDSIVKPFRYGERKDRRIICNRQLLIANAFEELLQQKFSFLHKHIRRLYNKIGNKIHRYYYLFNSKIISDFIFILMKPLELFFVFILYCVDKNPEDRIAQQYISKKLKLGIAEAQANKI